MPVIVVFGYLSPTGLVSTVHPSLPAVARDHASGYPRHVDNHVLSNTGLSLDMESVAQGQAAPGWRRQKRRGEHDW